MRGSAGGDPNRQTTLPSGRGVCLISSSCPGSLTAATGSDLAGRRLQQCALRTVLRHRAPRGRQWPCGATPSIYGCHAGLDLVQSVVCPHPRPIAMHCPPPRGREEARSAGRWGSFEGWPCAIPPCEEHGAAARRDEHFQVDDDRRVPSRSWSSEIPDRKRRPGRRHDRREVRLAKWSGSGTERSAGGAGLGRPEGVWSAGGGSKPAAFP